MWIRILFALLFFGFTPPVFAANEVLQKESHTICFADHGGDYSPTAANENCAAGSWTEVDVELDMASLANSTGYRQSTKFDFGATRAAQYAVQVALEIAATPTAGSKFNIYLAPSNSATAGTNNPGGVSGAEGSYAGYSSNAAASVLQLIPIGVCTVTAQATATVQIISCGTFSPPARYGSLVVHNNTGAALHSDDVEMSIALIPIVDEVQ